MFRIFLNIAIGLVFFQSAHSQTGRVQIANLTCDHLVSPLGLENTKPVIGWQLHSPVNNCYQESYEIIAATSRTKLESDKADIWQSGKITSSESQNISYKGAALQSRERCFWKVRVWTNIAKEPVESAVDSFEIGLLTKNDWKAKWISNRLDYDSVWPAPHFRKQFTVAKKVKSARAYVSGLGYFNFFLNGKKVGDHLLDPVVTRYDKTVKYLVFDITTNLRSATENVLGIVLGNGWYNQHTRSAWDFDRAPWRGAPAFICQAEIEYMDGSRETIVSDETWRWSFGAVVFDGIRNGEIVDARRSLVNWSAPGFDDDSWSSSILAKGPEGILKPQLMPPIRVVDTVRAVSIKPLGKGRFLVDFGKGMAGKVHIQATGHTGDTLTVKYGEKLKPDGTLDQAELARFVYSGETQTDHFIFSGKKDEDFEASFVYHGFQYVEVSGYPGLLGGCSIYAEEVHTDLQTSGAFSCSDTLLNKLQQATCQSFLSNYHGYPEDCPHREKIGWTGDAQLVAETGMFNFDLIQSYRKWLDDFVDEQKSNGQIPGIIPTNGWGYTLGRDSVKSRRGYGPQWEGAFVEIAWQLYRNTGDTGILRTFYPALKKYVQYLQSYSQDDLLDFGIEDHKFFRTETDVALISSAFFYHLTDLLRQMAYILDQDKDEMEFRLQTERTFHSFNRQFFVAGENIYGNGSQTGTGLALAFDLVPAERRNKIIRQLTYSIEKNGLHFDAGVLGVKAVVETLIKENHGDMFYNMLSQTDYPSFGYWIKNGATTLWQDWKGERSLDHIMFGSFADFFYKGLLGMDADNNSPGFKNVLLHPQFVNGISNATGSHHGPYGKIESSWARQNSYIVYSCTIPPNSTASLSLPALAEAISVNGIGVHNLSNAIVTKVDGGVLIHLQSGRYQFQFPAPFSN